jgi:lysozyme family protein
MRLTEELEREYQKLFDSCEARAGHRVEIEAIVKRVLDNKQRYESVSAHTGVPWYVIAAIHNLECSLRFDRHLHNGDPLSNKTKNVPPGRPPGVPPFTWEVSAKDALKYDNFTGWTNWSLPGTLYRLEGYNGWGYRNNEKTYGVKSPYLWSYSNHYTSGKYVSDRVFDPKAESKQCGAAVLLKALQEKGEIDFAGTPAAQPSSDARPTYPGRMIKQGEQDRQSVRILQHRLNSLGCGPIDVDGDFGSLTAAAVRLFQARSVDNDGSPLKIDGEVGPLTWEALFGSKTVTRYTPAAAKDPLLMKAIEIAQSQVGVLEDPPGSNRGKEVDEYQRRVGIPPGNPWCAAFVYWCFDQAARALKINNPVIKTGGVLDHWNQAYDNGIRRVTLDQAKEDPSLVVPGLIFIIDTGSPGGAGHTGLVERVDGGMLVTIEGNTNDVGSREGIGVFRRKKRKILHINKGFIDYRRA